ncbi:dipeptidyl-peptidase [Coprinopsis marcescibilis]|uniref:Dipeptidyl-peptidase n=1 Tax=Coprinopsis marcescibilis TaxID=230819 RepID=A0A5C3KGZ1_COPMA|nr:dipeptidyl-peptidase [Coprinopsis marcescibilis]
MRLSSEENLLQAGSSSMSEMQQTSQTTLVDPALIRPKIYYNDGPFETASSSDEEAESLLDDGERPGSPSMAELGLSSGRIVDGRSMRSPRSPVAQPPSTSLRWLLGGLAALVGLACTVGVIAAVTYTAAPPPVGLRKITMDHIFNGTFSAQSQSLHWVPEAGDGVFSVSTGGVINLVDLKTNNTRTLVTLSDIKDEHGNTLEIADWQVSADMKHFLVKADYRKQWRHSSFGNYYVHDIEAKTTWPIISPSHPSRTAYATWSPTGESIAYVVDNDLYVIPTAAQGTQHIRVTNAGNASLFHGVPDWVYEEEIFGGDFALWWSPDSRKVAFLAFDETEVPEFTFPIYNPTEDAHNVIPYSSNVVMKYPKPGYPNPLVSVHVFDLERYRQNHNLDGNSDLIPPFPSPEETLTLDWEHRHPVTNSVIMEIAWVADSTLILKEVNRNADDGHAVLFELEGDAGQRATGKVVRKLGKNGEQGDDGWIDADQAIYPLRSQDPDAHSAYLDIVPNSDGFNHIALFSPATSETPLWLTTGNWEVTGTIRGVDLERRLVYFVAAKPSSIERHLYSVELPVSVFKTKTLAPTDDPKALTDTTKLGYHSASFSPQAGFYLLSYSGPNVPWQRVIQVGNTTFDYLLTSNERLQNVTKEYEAPIVTYSTISYEGYEFNAREFRPPNFDDSGRTKYPVLFHVYGGPFSQQVDARFVRSQWATYLAAGLQYVVVSVDGRGTGYKGRKLRNPVKSNLGFFETIDQIEAAKQWAARSYVDSKRIGIWGWSYGGFMAGKVVEANAGVHTLAMSVAPVTSWLLYDTIYTERYMNLPALNPGGYVNASITNVTGFQNFDYLLAHGSGDDNVHYANTAHLLDQFTQEKVRSYRFRMFTDSDHSIARRGAQREIYEYLTAFLEEKWGKGAKRRG